MNSENDHDYFRCTVLSDSGKAYHVKLDHNAMTHWVPKSLCELKRATPDHYEGILEVEAWFAKKEGMHG